MSICIFGDSITWRVSDTERGGWVERPKVYVGEKYEDEVYNLGIPGDNTEGLLQRVEFEAKARKPKVIIFAIGINDSQYVRSENKRRVPIEQFKNNLAKLYDTAREFTEKIIFVGLTQVDETKTKPIPWNTDKEYDNDGVKQYDAAIREFCAGKNVKFVEMNVLELEDLEDGLHPNSDGHAKMFARIKAEIENELSA